MAQKKTTELCFSVPPITTAAELEEKLSEPAPRVIEALEALDGDILILGVNGKMGPTLAHMAARAVAASGRRRRVMGVSRSLTPDAARRFNHAGVETFTADLLSPGGLESLPEVENVLYLCGHKFGVTGAEWNTWATNVLLAGLTANRYKHSRIVAFSTGNLYPFEPVLSGGSTESTPVNPVGEYAMSCLGRERLFDYYSRAAGAKVVQFRLNYAVELRYGILHDVAAKVWNGIPVDVTMGNVNCVWQGYACGVALQALAFADAPPFVLNVTGPETVSIRWLANRMGELMDKTPILTGQEAETALLSNAARCHRLFGYPDVTVDKLLEWTAQWVMAGGESLGKPTHFEVRDGKY